MREALASLLWWWWGHRRIEPGAARNCQKEGGVKRDERVGCRGKLQGKESDTVPHRNRGRCGPCCGVATVDTWSLCSAKRSPLAASRIQCCGPSRQAVEYACVVSWPATRRLRCKPSSVSVPGNAACPRCLSLGRARPHSAAMEEQGTDLQHLRNQTRNPGKRKRRLESTLARPRIESRSVPKHVLMVSVLAGMMQAWLPTSMLSRK